MKLSAHLPRVSRYAISSRIDGDLVYSSSPSSIFIEKSAPTSNGGSMYINFNHHAFLISSLIGPYRSDERISLLSHRISLLVHHVCCLPLISNNHACILFDTSFLGSSTTSIVWKGIATTVVSFVFPFRTSSTWFLSANNKKRYSSGSGFHCSRWSRMSRFCASVRFKWIIIKKCDELKHHTCRNEFW